MKRYTQKFKEASKVDLKVICNLEELPKETQKFLYREIEKFNSIGHQTLIGYIGREAIIDMLGYWADDGEFVVDSYGIKDFDLSKKYRVPLQWKK